MSKQNKTIALFSGPSGGHLFPAIACAEALAKRNEKYHLYLFTSKKTLNLPFQLPENLFKKIIYLPNFPAPQGISLKSLVFLLKLAIAFLQSLFELIRLRPHVSVGFGSYASFPGMRVSCWLRIPTVIHEQNVVPGKANAWLAASVDCVALTFKETLFRSPLKKSCVTGLPLRASLIQKAKENPRSPSDKFRILVVGGSQGAKKINKVFLAGLELLGLEKREQIAVNHITGDSDFLKVSEYYKTSKINANAYRFFENLEVLYSQTDLIISRAGANTLSEIATFGLAALVVPYPHANAHQKENVNAFTSKNAMLMCEEKDLTAEYLKIKIEDLMENRHHLVALEERLVEFQNLDSAKKLADIVIKTMKERS